MACACALFFVIWESAWIAWGWTVPDAARAPDAPSRLVARDGASSSSAPARAMRRDHVLDMQQLSFTRRCILAAPRSATHYYNAESPGWVRPGGPGSPKPQPTGLGGRAPGTLAYTGCRPAVSPRAPRRRNSSLPPLAAATSGTLDESVQCSHAPVEL